MSMIGSTMLAALALGSPAEPFETPFRVRAAEGFIDVLQDHAAPLYEDIDEDGVKELLVGQFCNGALRVYKNHGTNTAPIFKGYEYLRTGETYAAVPSG